ncbi:MAG TPA: alpha/beta fold hydrolase [Thermoanaerobaculia bacterium]|nr:alpha/beta fold hydrolase [Thermoanaerobaculia bacterium]
MEKAETPPRPSGWEEKLSLGLFLALAPRLPRAAAPAPPEELRPFESVAVPRGGRRGPLAATWFPVEGPARGAVLLLHPWLAWGQAYFYRRGRIEALRAAGYHALTLDLGGFGGSGPRSGLFDRDVEAGLRLLRERAPGVPLHVWGVSSGGYWAHTVLSRSIGVAGAVFEDVSPHLLEWSWRTAPLGRPFYLVFRSVFRSTYRYLDIRRHAEALKVRAVAYVSGERDRGVRPEDTRTLASRAGGRAHIVPGAGHLGSIKVAQDEVIALALDTFRRAEEGERPGEL